MDEGLQRLQEVCRSYCKPGTVKAVTETDRDTQFCPSLQSYLANVRFSNIGGTNLVAETISAHLKEYLEAVGGGCEYESGRGGGGGGGEELDDLCLADVGCAAALSLSKLIQQERTHSQRVVTRRTLLKGLGVVMEELRALLLAVNVRVPPRIALDGLVSTSGTCDAEWLDHLSRVSEQQLLRRVAPCAVKTSDDDGETNWEAIGAKLACSGAHKLLPYIASILKHHQQNEQSPNVPDITSLPELHAFLQSTVEVMKFSHGVSANCCVVEGVSFLMDGGSDVLNNGLFEAKSQQQQEAPPPAQFYFPPEFISQHLNTSQTKYANQRGVQVEKLMLLKTWTISNGTNDDPPSLSVSSLMTSLRWFLHASSGDDDDEESSSSSSSSGSDPDECHHEDHRAAPPLQQQQDVSWWLLLVEGPLEKEHTLAAEEFNDELSLKAMDNKNGRVKKLLLIGNVGYAPMKRISLGLKTLPNASGRSLQGVDHPLRVVCFPRHTPNSAAVLTIGSLGTDELSWFHSCRKNITTWCATLKFSPSAENGDQLRKMRNTTGSMTRKTLRSSAEAPLALLAPPPLSVVICTAVESSVRLIEHHFWKHLHGLFNTLLCGLSSSRGENGLIPGAGFQLALISGMLSRMDADRKEEMVKLRRAPEGNTSETRLEELLGETECVNAVRSAFQDHLLALLTSAPTGGISLRYEEALQVLHTAEADLLDVHCTKDTWQNLQKTLRSHAVLLKQHQQQQLAQNPAALTANIPLPTMTGKMLCTTERDALRTYIATPPLTGLIPLLERANESELFEVAWRPGTVLVGDVPVWVNPEVCLRGLHSLRWLVDALVSQVVGFSPDTGVFLV